MPSPTSAIRLRPLQHHQDPAESSASSGDIPMSTTEPLLGVANDEEDLYHSHSKETKRRRRYIPKGIEEPSRKGWKVYRLVFLAGVGTLLVLGFIQLVTLLSHLVALVLPNGVDRMVREYGRPGSVGYGLVHYPTDFSRDILPKPCHSHNDYWRDVPLFSAIQAGCIGVEADIWRFEDHLYVGHSLASLAPNRTLANLYINPLLNILQRQNPELTAIPGPDEELHGVFDTDPSQSLILLIDFKTYGPSTWPAMYSALEPLRKLGYLTHVANQTIVQRPITVVGTGETPFDLVASPDSNPHRDVFFDGPLEKMYDPNNGTNTLSVTNARGDPQLLPRSAEEQDSVQGGQGQLGPSDPNAYNATNSYYASVPFAKAIGHLDRGEFSEHQLTLLRGQIKGAQSRGLKARYWDTPFWPIGLRNHVWDTLVKEGADFLNVDDLVGATQRDWGDWRGWWKKGRKTGHWGRP